MKKCFLFVVIPFFFSIFACTNSDDQNHMTKYAISSKDLVKEYDFAKKLNNTKLIDFTDESCERFLISGWSEGGAKKEGIWAVGLKSELYFIDIDLDSDLKMAIRCSPFLFKDSPVQKLLIYLNKANFVKEIVLERGFKTYDVMLSKEQLRFGENVLSFEYAYAEKPSKMSGSKDTRDLSVRFSRIEFDIGSEEGAKTYRAGNKIVQESGSVISFCEYLGNGSFLAFEFNNKDRKNLVGEVRISFDKYEPLLFRYTKSGEKKIDLQDYGEQYACISFSVKSASRSNQPAATTEKNKAIWSDMLLYGKAESADEDDKRMGRLPFNRAKKLMECDVIYIVFDAFTAGHSSSYGYERKTSPFFDHLSNKGFLFDRMFAVAPYTLASTSTLFTSSYSWRHGLKNQTCSLSKEINTLSNILSEKKISTFLITEHGFLESERWGLNRGFQKVYFDRRYRDDPKKICEVINKIYMSNNGSPNNRKFIYIHLVPPHAPYLPPQKYRVFFDDVSGLEKIDDDILRNINLENTKLSIGEMKYVEALYDANILFADHILKEIYSFLEKRGLSERTIVFITADHGEAFGQHGKMGHNTTLYDEMTHVPFLMVPPKKIIDKGERIKELASLVDVAPTIADIFRVGDVASFEGKSLLKIILEGQKEIRSFVYCEIPVSGQEAIRNLRFKLIKTENSLELYDIRSDPSEKENLTTKYPIFTGYLLQKMRKIKAKTKEPSNKIGTPHLQQKNLEAEVLESLKELGYIK